MNLEVYIYLNEYIQRNFSRYYESFDKLQLTSFLNNISSNSLIKNKDKNQILSGRLDVVIDKLVHEYAKMNFPDIWKSILLEYLIKYIQTKFSRYYRLLNKDEFNLFINNISLNDELLDYGLDQILLGNANNKINDLVIKYVKENMREVDKSASLLTKYILTLIKENSKFKDSLILLEKLSTEIALKQNFKVDFNELISGKYDNQYLNKYSELRLEYKTKFYNYIKNAVLSLDDKIGFTESALSEIFNDMSDFLLEHYNNDEEIYDVDRIKDCFLHISRVIKTKVKERVRTVMNDVDIILDISDGDIVFDIVNMATVRGEIDAIKIVKGEMDGFIKSYINTIRGKNVSKRKTDLKKSETLGYIYRFLISESGGEVIDSELYKFSFEVYNTLSERGFTCDDILNKKSDKLILDLYIKRYCFYNISANRGNMRANSVKSPKKNYDPLKLARIKKRIQQELAKILIVAVLGGAGGYVAGLHILRRENNEAIKIASEIDDTRYSISRYSDVESSYNDIANGIIDYYKQLKTYGDEYVYLCFYNAYSKGFSLNQMDKLLHNVQKAENVTGLNELVKGKTCYLDFIYESLLRMGCEKIKDGKYSNALLAYKQSFYGNIYGIASDYHIYSHDKALLEEMKEMYKEYSEKLQIELGNKISSQNDDVKLTGSGRSV